MVKDDLLDMKKTLVNNLQYFLKRKGINQTDMARDLNFPETTVSNWMKAETYPRPDKIQSMADYFGIKRSDLTEKRATNIMPYSSQFIKVPVLGEIACGEPILAEQNIEDHVYEPIDSLPAGEIFALKAKGDSMEPTIPNGALVLIREQSEVENGEIAAVLVNGDTEATLKRVKKQGDTILLMPDNPKHEPYIVNLDNPARIIGKAFSFKVSL